ncbi:MAG: DUF3048 domain-containing protein [Microbacterium sp.]|nr:MAG: DUF3048 domain-containing protein [Microbacterium sp.]
MEITGPALAAKIDNHWDARPQWGLERTDIVFEELVEGGLTRYVAVWFSDVPSRIGPVRSIRPMDPEIVGPLGGIIAFSGGRARFVQMIADTDLHLSIHGGKDNKYMYRSSEKRAPHNVVVEAQKLRKAYKKIDPSKQQFAYAEKGAEPTAVAKGTKAKGLDISFSNVSDRGWRWSGKADAYLRTQSGRKDVDSNGKQLRATNVLTLTVDVTYGEVPRTHLVGKGTGTLSTGGKTVKIRWSKKSRDSRIVISSGGQVAELAPGNTWVELVPERGSVKIVK